MTVLKLVSAVLMSLNGMTVWEIFEYTIPWMFRNIQCLETNPGDKLNYWWWLYRVIDSLCGWWIVSDFQRLFRLTKIKRLNYHHPFSGFVQCDKVDFFQHFVHFTIMFYFYVKKSKKKPSCIIVVSAVVLLVNFTLCFIFYKIVCRNTKYFILSWTRGKFYPSQPHPFVN